MALLDCIIIGGSYAGLSAALTLGRARRSVLVLDAGEPRNAASQSIHNLAGNEGISPIAWREKILTELAAYKTVRVEHGRAASASKASDKFSVDYESGPKSHQATSRTLLLSMGVSAAFPALLSSLPTDKSLWWGTKVFHCPYCSAYEASHSGTMAILALPHQSANDATAMTGQLSVWAPGRVELLRNGAEWALDAAQTGALEKNGVGVVSEKVEGVELDEATGDVVVKFADGAREPTRRFASLHLRPQISLSSLSMVTSLGVALKGPFIAVDGMGKTSVPGVWAAGDCSEPKAQVALAIAAGTTAAFGVAGELGMVDWGEGKLGGRL